MLLYYNNHHLSLSEENARIKIFKQKKKKKKNKGENYIERIEKEFPKVCIITNMIRGAKGIACLDSFACLWISHKHAKESIDQVLTK